MRRTSTEIISGRATVAPNMVSSRYTSTVFHPVRFIAAEAAAYIGAALVFHRAYRKDSHCDQEQRSQDRKNPLQQHLYVSSRVGVGSA